MASCNTRYCTYLYNQYPLLEGAQDGGAQVKSVGKNGTSLSRALANLSAVSSSGGCVSRDIQPSTVAIYCEITRQAVLMTHPFQLKYIRTNPELTTFHGDLNTFEIRDETCPAGFDINHRDDKISKWNSPTRCKLSFAWS